MFEIGDKVYFVFKGNWKTGKYKNHYCLYSGYFPFMPITIIQSESYSSITGGMLYTIELCGSGSWCLSTGCIERKFSFETFILAQLDWGKRVTPYQFQSIQQWAGSSNGRTDRS